MVGLLLAPSASNAAADPLIDGAKLCTKLLPAYEKQYGIPKHLLSAIATTESGRYHQDLKISIPWPWTINAEGKAYYLDSKGEAIATAKKLLKRGVQSMDVGCMQVNIRHHPEAFSSLDQAFNPKNNIAYAAEFLKTLYADRKSWKLAAADYHSKTPGKGKQYVGRVYESWEKLVAKLQMAQATVPESSLKVMRDMRPASASVVKPASRKYASINPVRPSALQTANARKYADATYVTPAKYIVVEQRQTAPLPEQAGQRVSPYAPARMNTVALSKKDLDKENSAIVVRSKIESAASGIVRANSVQHEPVLKTGPRFIFSD